MDESSFGNVVRDFRHPNSVWPTAKAQYVPVRTALATKHNIAMPFFPLFTLDVAYGTVSWWSIHHTTLCLLRDSGNPNVTFSFSGALVEEVYLLPPFGTLCLSRPEHILQMEAFVWACSRTLPSRADVESCFLNHFRSGPNYFRLVQSRVGKKRHRFVTVTYSLTALPTTVTQQRALLKKRQRQAFKRGAVKMKARHMQLQRSVAPFAL